MPVCQRGHALLPGEAKCVECGAGQRSGAPEPQGVADRSADNQSQIAVALIAAGSVVGLIMSSQSASLMTGTGGLWTGVALSAGAAIAAGVMRNRIPIGVVIAAVVIAIVAFSNARSVENELQDRQLEIQSDLSDLESDIGDLGIDYP